MGSKELVFLGLLLSIVFLFTTEATAKDLAENFASKDQTTGCKELSGVKCTKTGCCSFGLKCRCRYCCPSNDNENAEHTNVEDATYGGGGYIDGRGGYNRGGHGGGGHKGGRGGHGGGGYEGGD